MRNRTRFGKMELLVGIILVLLGVFSFIRPQSAVTGIGVIYGIVAVITGSADIVFYVRVERHTGFGPTVALVTGILSVMSGVMLLVYPGAGKWILSLLFPVWFIAHCISRLTHLTVIRLAAGNFTYYFTLIVNIIGLVLGIMMIFHPLISIISAGCIIGFYLLLLGIDSIVMAIGKLGSGW